MSGGNCSDTCEQALYLGAAGECEVDAVSGEYYCRCPDGFSGNGDFFLWDDCRVNVTVQFVMHVALAVASGVCAILSLSGLVYLLLYWDYLDPEGALRRGSGGTTFSSSNPSSKVLVVHSPPESGSHEEEDDGESGESQESDEESRPPPARRKLGSLTSLKAGAGGQSGGSAASLEGLSPTASKRARKQARKQRHREYFSFLALAACTMYSSSSAAYAIPYLLGASRWEVNGVQDAALVWMVSCILIGCWAFFYLFYMNLPSLRLYGRLFGVSNSLLINRPKFVRGMTIFRCVSIVAVNSVILFFLPLIYIKPNPTGDAERELSMRLYKALNWMLAVWALDFVVFSTWVLHMLGKLFRQLRQLSGEAQKRGITTGSEKSTFETALRVIVDAQIAVLILGLSCVLIFTLTATLPAVRESSYVVATLNSLIGNIVALVMLYFTVFKLRGAKTPHRRRRSTHSSKSSGAPSGSSPGPPTGF